MERNSCAISQEGLRLWESDTYKWNYEHSTVLLDSMIMGGGNGKRYLVGHTLLWSPPHRSASALVPPAAGELGPLHHSSADVCVLCVVGKKPTSRRKVVDRTPVHDVKSNALYYLAPWGQRVQLSFWHLTGLCCLSGIALQLNYQPAPDMKTGLSPSTVSRGSRNLLFLVKYSPSQKVFGLTQAFRRAGVNHRIHTLYDLE